MAAEWFAAVLNELNQVDLRLLHDLNALAGNWAFDHTVDFVCSNNLLRGTLPVAFYWYFWFKRTPDQAPNRVTIVKGIIATITAVIIARGLAHLLPHRLRPFADPGSGFVQFLQPNDRSYEDWSSFPSDTAAFEFALCWSLFYISRACSISLLVYTAICACLTRVYIGVHYPSDIVVGAAIGILSASGLHMIPVPRLLRHPIIRGEGSHPVFYMLAFFATSELAQVFDNVRAARRHLASLMLLPGHRVWLAAGIAVLAVAIAVAVALWLIHTRRRPDRRQHSAASGSDREFVLAADDRGPCPPGGDSVPPRGRLPQNGFKETIRGWSVR